MQQHGSHRRLKKISRQIPDWVITAIWTSSLICFIALNVWHASNSYYGYSVCEGALKKSYESCELAVALAGGESSLVREVEVVKPFTVESSVNAVNRCSDYGYEIVKSRPVDVAYGTDKTPYSKETVRILSKNVTEVLPNILIVDMVQTYPKNDNATNRVGCVASMQERSWISSRGNSEAKTITEIVSVFVGAEEIPMNWPEVSYSEYFEKKDFSQDKILGIYNVFVRFGANTLFSAIGLFIAILICEEYQCKTFAGMYRASFIMGLLDLGTYVSHDFLITFSFLWLPITVLSALIASACVNDFTLDWRRGFSGLLTGTAIITMTKGILCVLLYGLISWWVGS